MDRRKFIKQGSLWLMGGLIVPRMARAWCAPALDVLEAGLECTEDYAYESADVDININDNSARFYVGSIFNTNYSNVCQIDIKLTKVAGDISGKTFYLELWTMSGSDLDTVQEYTTVAGNNSWSDSWQAFTFSNISITSGWGITLSMHGEDGSNFAEWETNNSGSGTDVTGVYGYDYSKVRQVSDSNEDPNIRVYTLQ